MPINCKAKKLLVNWDNTLWPCCWVCTQKDMSSYLKNLPKDWNNLNIHSVEDILNTNYYKQVLQDSWDPQHNLHISRCIRTCAKNRAYHNELKYAV